MIIMTNSKSFTSVTMAKANPLLTETGRKGDQAVPKHSECGRQKNYPDQAVDDSVRGLESRYECVVDMSRARSGMLTDRRFHPVYLTRGLAPGVNAPGHSMRSRCLQRSSTALLSRQARFRSRQPD